MLGIMTKNSRLLLPYTLLASLIISWGLSWPVTKIALITFSPLWLTALRLLIAAIALFIVCASTHNLKIPRKADLPMLFVIGIFQIGLFLLAVNIGLQYVSAGHGVVLTYTTPLWVVPVVTLTGKETLTRMKAIGLIFGFIGILLLVNPWQLDWSDRAALLGTSTLIGAALSWAIALLYARYATWHSTPLQLISWQLLLAFIPTVLLAMHYEPWPQQWHSSGIISLLFLSLLCTGFGFWAMVVIARSLPIIITTLWLLLVPVIGIASAQWLIHETPDLTLIIASCFVLCGLAFVSLGQWHQQRYRLQKPSTYQQEVEIKLAITQKQISHLLGHELIKQYAKGELTERQCITLYYDTPNYDLRRYGVSLRVRYDGEQYIQCLKKKSSIKKGITSRDEWETVLEDASPNFAAIPDPELRSQLLTGSFGETLQPIFTTDFSRQLLLLQLPDDTELELVIDQGVVAVADLSEPISEIELELRNGDENSLVTFSRQLMADLGLTIEERSKASRGYVLRQQLDELL